MSIRPHERTSATPLQKPLPAIRGLPPLCAIGVGGDDAPPPPPPQPPPDHVPERGGPWVAEQLDPGSFPALETTMPLTRIYEVGEDGERVPHLLVA